MKHLLKSLLLLAGTFFALISCSNLIDSKAESSSSSQVTQSADGKTYIRVGTVSKNAGTATSAKGTSRTVLPNTDTRELTNLVLGGMKRDSADEEMKVLAQSGTLAELSQKSIELAAGEWFFNLSATSNGATFVGETEATLTTGQVTALSFVLSSTATNGGFSLTVNFEGTAACVVGTVLNTEFKPVSEDLNQKELSVTALQDKNAVVFAQGFDPTDESSGLSSGTYTIQIEFYGDSERTISLNTYTETLRIKGGYVSTAERTISLNKTYSITYIDNGGELAAGATRANAYSRKSGEVALPQMEKEGYIFNGWYENADFSGTAVTEIAGGTTGNLTLYAFFVNTIYVSSSGSADNSGFTKVSALGSIADAVAKIIEINEPSIDWNIAVSGTLSGAQTISDVSLENVRSLTLSGANGLDGSTHQPKDSIEVNGEENALTISAEIPVTVRDIKITKGTEETAHGVYVSENSKIYLAGTPVLDDLYAESNEYYDWDAEKSYGAIVIAENLGSGASVTITPKSESDYPYYDDYESHEVCITKYIYSFDGVEIADNCEYFHVTPKDGSTEEFFIDEYGRINKNITVKFVSSATSQNFTKSVLFGRNLDELDIKPNEVSDYTFSGWFKSEDEGVTLTDKVSLIYEEDLTLYAKWAQPISDLYVDTTNDDDGNAKGSDENAGTSDAPLKTVSAAVAKIKDFGVAMDYTIHVTGLCTEEDTITLDESVSATSITFTGGTDSGITNKSYGSTPLVVETSVPVTLDNFIIYANGYVNQTNDTLALYVGSNADVTLNNGSKIYGNDTSSYGGKAGVRISGGKVTMNGNSQIYGFAPKYTGSEDTNASGGVLIDYSGQLVMNGTSSIHSCEAKNKGGAIHLASGSVVMNDSASIGGEDKGCSASTNGGAVYMSGGTFKMNGSSSISYCTKGSNGKGSIWIAGGTFTMNGGSIHDNTGGVQVAADASDSYGYNGTFIMNGGTISNNGTGVYVASTYTSDYKTVSGVFDMQGGTISDHEEHGVQVEAYVGYSYPYPAYSGTFRMSKDALVDSSNDVYLDYGEQEYGGTTITSQAKILITGALEGDSSNPIKATITPSSYSTDTTVLTLADGADPTLVSEYAKFALSDTSTYEINNSGKLQKNFSAVTEDDVKAKETSMTTDDIVSDYQTLLGKQIYFKTSSGSYGVMQFTQVEDYDIQFKFKIGSGSVQEKTDGFQCKYGFDLDGDTTDDNNKDFGIDGDSPYTFTAYNDAMFYVLD